MAMGLKFANLSPNLSFVSDDNFLLRFLRVKKFSLPMAENMLLKYLNLRQTFAHLAKNLDCLDPALSELVDNG